MSEEKTKPIIYSMVRSPHGMKDPICWMTVPDHQQMTTIPDPEITAPPGARLVFPLEVNFRALNIKDSEALATLAIHQHVASVWAGLKGKESIPEGDALWVNYMSKFGEATVAITTNRYFEFRINTLDRFADLCGEEIKTRGWDPKYVHMLVDKSKVELSPKGMIYWMVTGRYPTFKNQGWATAAQILKFGGEVPEAKSFGIHMDLLNKWMPTLDPFYYVKSQSRQGQLKLTSR
jgi:hypothetical protein